MVMVAQVFWPFSIFPESADLPGADNLAGTPMWNSINAYVSYDSLTTRAGLTGCDNTDYEIIRGYFEREVTNFDLGTTATYTRSIQLSRLWARTSWFS